MSNVLEFPSRTCVVKVMAEHLVAAILHDRLDTSSDIDVIECLRSTPERFNWRTIHDHMDDALYSAKQTVFAMEMSRP